MNKKYLFAAVILALFITTVWYMDPFLLIILGVAPLVWIGLPFAIIAIVVLFAAKRAGRSHRQALNTLVAIGGFGCFVGLAIPVNHLIQQAAVSDAKAFPARVAPLLEAYRKAHGAYPTSIDQLPSKPVIPRLLRRYGYHSNGQSYSFMFPQPGGLIDTWHYDSDTQTWHLST